MVGSVQENGHSQADLDPRRCYDVVTGFSQVACELRLHLDDCATVHLVEDLATLACIGDTPIEQPSLSNVRLSRETVEASDRVHESVKELRSPILPSPPPPSPSTSPGLRTPS